MRISLRVCLIASLCLAPLFLFGGDQKTIELSGIPFPMPAINLPVIPNHDENIVAHGAVADGRTMNTNAIESAMTAAAKAGGGRVVVPAGTWLTGPVRLQSNINLHLEKGAVLLFSRKFEDYPLVRREGSSRSYRCISPISGTGLENIAITGEGIIDGGGDAWRPVKKSKLTAGDWKRLVASGGAVDGDIWWPSAAAMNGEKYIKELEKSKKNPLPEEYAVAREYLRPDLLLLVGCRTVLLDGPTFQNSPMFCVQPIQCSNMVVRNIFINNEWNAQNGDGLDIKSCYNVLVDNVTVNAGDDGICLKPGRMEKGALRTASCENIVIQNSVVYHGHGGFVIGSETYGGARNIFVRNCVFSGTDVGLRFKSGRTRGGLIEKIYIENVRMVNIVHEAILFDTYYGEDTESKAQSDQRDIQPVNERTPRFRDFALSNITCNGAARAMLINGLPEMPVEAISMKNVKITAEKGMLCVDAKDIVLIDVSLQTLSGPVFSLRHTHGMTLQRVDVLPADKPFLFIGDSDVVGILLIETELTRAAKGIELGAGALESAVMKPQ
jgi:polygalacturonase